jgi:hypothetical protein
LGNALCRDSRRRAPKLRPRDSNPDYLVQSEACCHYTRAHRAAKCARKKIAEVLGGADGVQIGVRVRQGVALGRHVRPALDQLARLHEVLRALD